MKICFIGIGSIAKRHIRNLKILFENRKLQIDALHHNNKLQEIGLSNQYFNIEDMPDDYDVIFITNPTSLHIHTLNAVQHKSKAFFIEKPLRCMHQDKTSNYMLDRNKICYVACPLRYTSIIQYLKQNINWTDVYSVRSISSSYLPEWRIDSDYRKSYSASKKLGGGVASDLIHEWDYLVYLMGKPIHVLKMERKVSLLDITSEDVAIYIAEYKDKVVEVHLDYFGRTPIRQIELFTKDNTFVCDFIQNLILDRTTGKLIKFQDERNDFQMVELNHFFDIVNGRIENDNTLEDAEALLCMLEA